MAPIINNWNARAKGKFQAFRYLNKIYKNSVNLSNQIQLRKRASFVHTHDVSKQIPREKNFSIGLKMLWNNWFMSQLCVHQDMKHLGSLPGATLTHLSCSRNFPRTSYLDERTLTYEPIVKWLRLHFFSVKTKEKYSKKLKSHHLTGFPE